MPGSCQAFKLIFWGLSFHSGDGEMLESRGRLVATDRQRQYDRSLITQADRMADSHVVIVLTDIVSAGF
jgi:hypothetical protein